MHLGLLNITTALLRSFGPCCQIPSRVQSIASELPVCDGIYYKTCETCWSPYVDLLSFFGVPSLHLWNYISTQCPVMYAILGFSALGVIPGALAQQSVWGQCEFLPSSINVLKKTRRQHTLTSSPRRWNRLVRRQNMRIREHMRSPERLLLPMPTRHRGADNLDHPPHHHQHLLVPNIQLVSFPVHHHNHHHN
jgi:hypothetical protein